MYVMDVEDAEPLIQRTAKCQLAEEIIVSVASIQSETDAPP
jgi:hypothetical protein